MAPDFRRCCWYTIFGAVSAAAVFCGIARFIQNRGLADILTVCILFAVLAVAMVVPLRWKVRVDQDGVARRFLWGWDLWPWAGLESGRIRKLHPYTLHDPDRPWWRRRFRLEYLAPGDLEQVITLVNSRYKLPPPPDVPTTLTIKYGPRRHVAFDPKGILLTVGHTFHEYRWDELQEIHITRMDPVRRDFKSLVVILPDDEIELQLRHQHGAIIPIWRGPAAEEINEYFAEHVSPDQIHISIVGQPLRKREYIERELEKAKKTDRELVIMLSAMLFLLVGMLAWIAIADGILKAAFLGAMFAICPGSVCLFLYRRQHKEVSDLSDLLNRAEPCMDHRHQLPEVRKGREENYLLVSEHEDE